MATDLPHKPLPLLHGILSASPRPASVTLIAVLSMVFGALGTLGCGVQALQESIATFSDSGLKIRADTVLPFNRPLLVWTTGVSIADLLTSAGLFVCGYLSLRLNNTARKWAVGISVFMMLLAVTKLAASIGYFRQAQLDIRHAELAALTAEEKKNVPPDIDEQIRKMSLYGPIVLCLLQSFVPLLILLVWTRKDVQQAFIKPV